MPKSETFSRAECKLATARGLMDSVHFIFDHCHGADWLRMKTSLGFLLNTLSAELAAADRGVETLYSEQATENRRSH